jgi:hypothetical protein
VQLKFYLKAKYYIYSLSDAQPYNSFVNVGMYLCTYRFNKAKMLTVSIVYCTWH